MDRDKRSKIFTCIISKSILVVAAIIIVYLTVMSLFSTGLIEIKNYDGDNWGEYTYFLKDSPVWLLIGIILLIIAACVLRTRIRDREHLWIKPIHMLPTHIQYILLALFFLTGLIMLVMTRQYPKSDQGKILRIAGEIIQGNFEQFAVGGYMHRYPDQTGIVLIISGVIRIFGKYTYLIVQFMNLLMLTGSIWIMKCIAEVMFQTRHKNIGLYTIIIFLFFLPIYPYVTFIYGTVPGFFFAILAIYIELIFFRSRRLITALASAICIATAIIFKTNSLIMAIAMVLFLLYDIVVSKKKLYPVIYIGLIVLVISSMNHITNTYMEKITGVPVAEGMPKMAWIAMGLQDAPMAPGWWNGYSVNLYEECGYNYELTTELAKENIKDNLGFFYHNKKDGLARIGRKMASQWNNPTFQCFQVNEGRESSLQLSPFAQSMISGKLRNVLTIYMNFFQSIMLSGVLFYLVFSWKRNKVYELLPVAAVIGGFVFHIFWEAKPQYVLPYFLLLFPYGVCGYQDISCLTEVNIRQVMRTKDKAILKRVIIIAAVIGMVFAISNTTVFKLTVGISDSSEILNEYKLVVEDR